MNDRILLKISGEMFASDGNSFDPQKIHDVAQSIFDFKTQCNVDLVIVVGAGNLWRFRDNQHLKLSRTISDKLGMTATNFNAVLLAEMLKELGDLVSAVSVYGNADYIDEYNSESCRESLSRGKTIVFAGGTGSPYSTTDSASVLRALELECDIVYKATKVDGVYDKDPQKHSDAVRFSELSFAEALSKNLKVMDASAFGMAMENDLPILVFDFSKPKILQSVYQDSSIGTLVS